jgi:hypothetical protein
LIALHFIGVIAVSAYFFGIGSGAFYFVILANAGCATATAIHRREKYGLPAVTLWDEVIGFLIVALLARFIY